MTKRKNKSILGSVICPICGKSFIPAYYHVYVTKRNNGTVVKYQCSYTCWRKAGNG